MAPNASELIKKSIKGDENSFNKLCEANAKKILFTCMKIMGNKQDGEDAAQEVFLKMKKSISTLKSVDAYNAWANRIIMNTCMNTRKKSSKEKGNVSLDEYTEFIVDDEISPTTYLEEKERREFLIQTISNLSVKYRTVIILYYYDGLDRKSIAEAMETSVDAVDHVLARARIKIRKSLESKFKEKVSVDEYSGLIGVPVITAVLNSEADAMVPDKIAQKFFEETLSKYPNLEFQGGASIAGTAEAVVSSSASVTKIIIVAVTIISVGIFSFIVPLNLSRPESPSGEYMGNNNGVAVPQQNTPDSLAIVSPEGDLDIINDKTEEQMNENVEVLHVVNKTLVGNVSGISSNGENTSLQEENISDIEVSLLDSKEQLVKKIAVQKDGSYSLENIAVEQNEKYSLKVTTESNPQYSVVTLNKTGMVEIEVNDQAVQVVPTIYLKNVTKFDLAISLINGKGEVTEVNPTKALIITSNDAGNSYMWEILDKATNAVVKSGEGSTIGKEAFSLNTGSGVKEYILRVTAQNTGQTVTSQRSFYVAKRSQRVTSVK